MTANATTTQTATTPEAVARLLWKAKADHQARNHRYTDAEESLTQLAQSFMPEDATVFVQGTHFVIHFSEKVQRAGTADEAEKLAELYWLLNSAGQFQIQVIKGALSSDPRNAALGRVAASDAWAEFTLYEPEGLVGVYVYQNYGVLENFDGTLAEALDYALQYAI